MDLGMDQTLAMGQLALFGALKTWGTPLWILPVLVAIGFLALYVVYLALQATVPKIAAIAYATTKQGIAQPLFWVLIAFGFVFLFIFAIIPYFTLGEDSKMVKDNGLMLILVMSILLALWTASVSIAEELEGRTALTLLSKPINRRQFVIGKFLGVLGPVAVMYIILSVPFLTSVSYMVVLEARETGNQEPSSAQCQTEMIQILPGLALGFMETVVLTSISVAISTRLPMLANLMICTSVYVLGHLVPLLLQSARGKFPAVEFVGRFIATVLPSLENFNVSAAIAGKAGAVSAPGANMIQRVAADMSSIVPYQYLAGAAMYCVLYSAVGILAALIMFEDRDLA
jgi:ABC-type transport system involved in multi-copper enzyme maturation permease subunit